MYDQPYLKRLPYLPKLYMMTKISYEHGSLSIFSTVSQLESKPIKLIIPSMKTLSLKN